MQPETGTKRPKSNSNGSDSTLPKGKCSTACQTDLTADEIDNLVSELEECRRKNKILSEKLENKKDLERELNTEDMIRDDESVKFYTGLPNLACFNLTLGLIQPYTKSIKCWDKKKNGKSYYQNDLSKKILEDSDIFLRKKSISWYFADCVWCAKPSARGHIWCFWGFSCKIVTTWVCLLAKLFDGTLLRWPTCKESKVVRKNTLTPELSLGQLNFPLRSPHLHVLRRPHGVTTNTIVHFNYWSELHLVELLLSSRNCGQEAQVSGRLSRGVVPLIFLRRVTI